MHAFELLQRHVEVHRDIHLSKSCTSGMQRDTRLVHRCAQNLRHARCLPEITRPDTKADPHIKHNILRGYEE